MPLSEYPRKRRSGKSPEPSGARKRHRSADGPRFVIQHHAAHSDHYDFRLEIDGMLVSWADARRKPVKSQPESVLSGRTLDDL